MSAVRDILGSVGKGVSVGASSYANAKMADADEKKRAAREQEKERLQFDRELKFADVMRKSDPNNHILDAYYNLLNELGYVPDDKQKKIFLETYAARNDAREKEMEDAKLAMLYGSPTDKIPSSFGGDSFAGIDFGPFAEAEGVGPNPTPTQAGALMPYYKALSGVPIQMMNAVGAKTLPNSTIQNIVSDVRRRRISENASDVLENRKAAISAANAYPTEAERRSADKAGEYRPLPNYVRDIRSDYRRRAGEWGQANQAFKTKQTTVDPGPKPKLEDIFNQEWRESIIQEMGPRVADSVALQLGIKKRIPTGSIPPMPKTWKGTQKQWIDYLAMKGVSHSD